MEISSKQKQDITDIFNSIFNTPLNQSPHIITDDIILNGIKVINAKTLLKMKMGKFYEELFCYLCNFEHPKKGFDLVNKKEQIFIELKTSFSTDNHNSKHSKFHLLGKYKASNPTAKVCYICLNDKRAISVNYTHHFGSQIITGTKAWEFFCECYNVDMNNLINFLRALVNT